MTLVAPHGITALHAPVRCPVIKKRSVVVMAPTAVMQPARLSSGVARGRLQVIQKHLGLLQTETTGGVRVLQPARGQVAQTEQSEQEWEGNPTKSFPMSLCTEKGQPHTEYGAAEPHAGPSSPHLVSSSGAAVPQSLLEDPGWRYLGQCRTQRTSLGPGFLRLPPVSHVEYAHPSEPEPWS